MPNWKKVIVSGSDALLNSLTTTGNITSITGGITGSDVTIDDWGSISASLASISSTGSNQTLQDVTDNGATTTNSLTIDSGTITINASNGAGVGGDTIFNGGYKTVNTEKKASFVEDNDLGVTDLFKTSYKLSDNTLTSIPDGKYFYQSQYQYRDGTGASDFAYGFKFLGQRGSSGGDTSNEASIFKIGISTNSGTWNNAIFRIHGNSLNGGGNGYIHMFNPIINEALLISGSTQAIEARTYGITQTLKSGVDEDPYNDTGDLKTIEIGTDQFAVSSSYIDLPNLEENPSDKTFRILVGGHDSDQSGPHFNGQRGSGLVKYITSQSLFEGTGIVSGSTAQTLQQVTDNGSTTTNNITISGSGVNLILTGGNTIETDETNTSTDKKVCANGGVTSLFLVSGTTYAGAIVDYAVFTTDRNNQRTGTITITANSTTVKHSELVTTDMGNTDGVIVETTAAGGNFEARINNNSGTSFNIVYSFKLFKV